MTAAEYQAMIANVDKPRKYHNKPEVYDGIRFDSKAECARYVQLMIMKRAGQIRSFNRQPSFLLPGGVRYRPDFIVFGKDDTVWCEDVKSSATITQAFRIKQRLWAQEYPNLELRIVK
jgi:hypothetical protein